MTFRVRPGVPEDAVAIAAIWQAVLPHLVKTAAGIEAELRASTARKLLVATDSDGTDGIVGYGSAWLPEESGDGSRVSVLVPAEHRGRGVGSGLAEQVEAIAAPAGAGSLLVAVTDDSREFAVRRGFAIGRELSYSAADLAGLPEPAAIPDGMRLADFTGLDPRRVWEAFRAVAGDDPSGFSSVPAYDEWLAAEWRHPDHALDLSMAVLDGDTVASFVSTTADPGRGVVWSNLTGTRPAYRGHGLAKVVKSHALARCRDAGITMAHTGNDANNHPMLAVNRWLGYRLAGSQWVASKVL
jgi:GNAT superfamily N-acetyltransferase